MSHDPASQNTPQPVASRPVWASPAREAAFATWLHRLAPQHALKVDSVRAATADASFRRYFRVDSAQGSCIVMDAPPEQEDCRPFVKIAHLLEGAGLRVPHIMDWDEANGFMLLSDLGTHTMMQVIDPQNPAHNHPMYLQAVDALITWQRASQPDMLAPYDEAFLRREMNLFPEWYLQTHRKLAIDPAMQATLDQAFTHIVNNNLSWPKVYVHRDFMPRNLMVSDDPAQTELGIIDFQGALYGPITYDIASLMRDAFLSWDEDMVLDITVRYWEKARKAGLPVGDDFGEFYKGVEWMGLQRHLKIGGLFARLTLRDGKAHYLADVPRFINYIRSTCSRYRELKPLLRLIDKVEGIEDPSTFVFGRV